jgi:hypothetical protein
VISAAKLAANRANARKSTGPRTRAGKLRSSQNARRHGLTTPPDAAAEARIADLARAMADTRPHILAAAAGVAAAQHDLDRVRRAHLDLLAKIESGASNPEHLWRIEAMDNFERRARSRRASATYRFELFARLLRDEGAPCQNCKNEPTQAAEGSARQFCKNEPTA